MFRMSIFNRRIASRTCGTILWICALLVLSTGAGMAGSAYHPVTRPDVGYEMTDRAPRPGKWKKLWKWSAAALVAGSSMDVASSWGYAEANGMLRSSSGHLHARGTAIKFGVLGAALIGQHYLVKKNPELEKPLAITNFAIGATYSGVAVRNWRVR
ncbi:MAG: hypothetical protein KIT83_03290 [Bryobacterales bacterium]|nr:hypothetical protein [Bryobacterales bacterium]